MEKYQQVEYVNFLKNVKVQKKNCPAFNNIKDVDYSCAKARGLSLINPNSKNCFLFWLGRGNYQCFSFCDFGFNHFGISP